MKEIIKKAFVWLKEHNAQWYMLFFLVCTYVLTAYETELREWYNLYVIPVLKQFVSSLLSTIICLLLLTLVVFDIVGKWKNNYHYNSKAIAIGAVVLTDVSYYRLSGIYEYFSLLWTITYVDIIILILSAYLIAYVCSLCKNYVFCKKKKDEGQALSTHIMRDWPIDDISEDVLSWENEVRTIADEIINLDRKKTWSLAITAPWGMGKTSFLNLIVNELKTNDIEVVSFNPRDSRSYLTIQEDFFNTIACTLSKYHSGCSSILKDYMASLQLIDNRGIVEKVVNFYKIWNKKNLKDEIKDAFKSLRKRILVLIDDFDRLSKEEIMEVLKLIDSNAAFNNLIFITAYDKCQVNKTLGEQYQTKDVCFVDKFFNIEYHVPSRSYTYVSSYLVREMGKKLGANEEEKNSIMDSVSRNYDIYKDYLPTIRDVKRYINIVALDYIHVKEEVNLNEYLLLHLIKYKYPEEFTNIHRRNYTIHNNLTGNVNVIYLQNNHKESIIAAILEKLFPNKGESRGELYRHIYNKDSFEYYFANKISGSLEIKEMKQVFNTDFSTACKKFDGWIDDKQKIFQFIDYLDNFDMDSFDNDKMFIQYVNILTYIATKSQQSYAYSMFYRVISLSNLKGLDRKYNITMNEIRNAILAIITAPYNKPDYSLIQQLHYNFKCSGMKEDEELIKDADIWPVYKQAFLDRLKEESVSEATMRMLYGCIDHMEQQSSQLFIDKDCLEAMRLDIEKNPYYYIEKFVRLGMISSNPEYNSITCEPFCKQIFGDEEFVEKFLEKCQKNKLYGSDKAMNFWLLYKANGYKPIEFMNQGNVQDKIDNNLVEEVKALNRIKSMERKVNSIAAELSSSDENTKQKYKKQLKNMQEQLKDIRLKIKLYEKIKKILDVQISCLDF